MDKLLFAASIVLAASVANAQTPTDGLTFYASFNNGANADFAKGDKSIYTLRTRKPKEKIEAGIMTDKTHIVSSGGLTGGALRFTDKSAPWLFFKADENLPYAARDWSGSVSFWMKVDTKTELAKGYSDPIQITTKAWNDAAFFVDFDKEGDPREFRLGAFADKSVWNPSGKEISEDKRPLHKVTKPPFSGEEWTHVAFTWTEFNTGKKNGTATLYLNGRKHGTIDGWNQQFTWKDDENARILIGLSYVGMFDDLSCFNRCLSDVEIAAIFAARDGSKLAAAAAAGSGKKKSLKRAFVNGEGPGWRKLTGKDFVNVNCKPDTWRWEEGTAYCTGQPVGVIRSTKEYTNFELVAEWMHKKKAGNSGIFVWGSPASIKQLEAGKMRLPHGIEVQVLDLGYAEQYKKNTGKPADWFTSHGDVFPTGPAKMKPFPPIAPNGRRSFPSKNLTLGINQWNHYYVRAINGEVRLWVNGEEVSGGTNCDPKTGYLCLESEGSPVVFRNLRIRELP